MTIAQPDTPDRIHAALKASGRSQKWVAEQALIPLTTFRRKLQGGGDFSLTELLAIATALDVAPTSLLPDAFADGQSEAA